MATYAIGDVQGCYQALRALLDEIHYHPQQDTLWFCGDLVNRGPQSLDVLKFVSELDDKTIVVLGNHDMHLLARAAGIDEFAHTDNFNALLDSAYCETLCTWLRQKPLVHHDSDLNMTLVHAGISPLWSIENALSYSQEVQSILRGPDSTYQVLLEKFYGNEPALWHDDLQEWDRLRCIINYCTRMRFCLPSGQMNLDMKGGLDNAPAGTLPWFEVPGRVAAQDEIVFGHWAALNAEVSTPHVHAIDGGYVWGGELIALRLEDKKRFSVNSAHYT